MATIAPITPRTIPETFFVLDFSWEHFQPLFVHVCISSFTSSLDNRLGNKVLKTCMLLAGVRVHEHC